MEVAGLSIGRIVHYVLENGEHRPAIIVRVWNKDPGAVNSVVFLDGSNDTGSSGGALQMWVTSVVFSETPKPNTYHWPEREKGSVVT